MEYILYMYFGPQNRTGVLTNPLACAAITW